MAQGRGRQAPPRVETPMPITELIDLASLDLSETVITKEEVYRILPHRHEMALIDAEPRSATATACGHCKVARVDERRFTFLVQQHPFFALHVMRVLAARLRHMDDTLH